MSHYEGRVGWFAYENWWAISAIVLDDKIAFDVEAGDGKYTLVLKPAAEPDRWFGSLMKRGGESSMGRADARLYRGADGRVALIGTWDEYDETMDWIAELSPKK